MARDSSDAFPLRFTRYDAMPAVGPIGLLALK